MHVFNLTDQNKETANKITAGLEKIGQVFRSLLWEKAKDLDLSPVQIQLLLFVQQHQPQHNTVSYLAKEFLLTKATISDAVKVLEKKKLVSKHFKPEDGRSYSIKPTVAGKKIIRETENFAEPVARLILQLSSSEKNELWKNISSVIELLYKSGAISVQRNCTNCGHYSIENKTAYCNLLKTRLNFPDIRMDCPEFDAA